MTDAPTDPNARPADLGADRPLVDGARPDGGRRDEPRNDGSRPDILRADGPAIAPRPVRPVRVPGSVHAPPPEPEPRRSWRDRLLPWRRRHGSEVGLLALQHVSKVYPNGTVALRDVDLVIPEGDFVFLVGPSGAGKSTFLRLIFRDEVATRGKVLLDGRDLARLPRRSIPKIRRRIGVVFQDFKLLPQKTVRENVAFALEVTGAPRRRIGPAVERALAVVGLTDQAGQLPSQLSGGEQQRTAIARAMVHDPRMIIADEPTGNLDPVISWEIIQLLMRINGLGVTILMATHDADVVTALRRRVIAIEDGRVIRDEAGGAYHLED